MPRSKLLMLLLIITLIVLFFGMGWHHYLTLDSFKQRHGELSQLTAQHPLLTATIYFLIYVSVTALSLPGAAILTLAGGALFGLWQGLLLISFASSIGATLAFLFSRYVFKDSIQKRFNRQLKQFNQGIERDGALYLFTLRLVPVFPFFLINLLMGLTPLKTRTFYWVSQIGMLAGTAVYVNAGTQLGQLDSLSGILSPGLLFSFALLGLFPLLAKKFVEYLKQSKSASTFVKPAKYDYNLLVIGAGAGGLVSAYIAAAVKAKVGLIEKHKMGGDCLNTGCVPSKALIRAAKVANEVKQSGQFGIHTQTPEVDFAQLFEKVQQVISEVEPHDSVERYQGLGVDCLQGEARILSPYQIQVGEEILTCRSLVVATGAKPMVPQIPGLDQVAYYTSDTLWQLREHPGKLIVLGGGPIGCELTQAFSRLGVSVTQIEKGNRLLRREDPDASEWIERRFQEEGVRLLTEHQATAIEVRDGEKYLVCQGPDQTQEIPFDTLLLALGRTPNTKGFGLEELGVELSESGAIKVDDHLQTSVQDVYAVGDVVGAFQFTHTAAHQAWYAAVNSLFGRFKRFRVDYSVIPWATFTDPEVARVGLNEQEAKKQHIPYEMTLFEMGELDRAIADRSKAGYVKVLTVPGKDKILGVTIVGTHAGDIIAEYVQAMKQGLGLNKILGTIHIYPTLSEANKYAAGEWKKAHAPEKLLKWVSGYHRWIRRR